jgi:hypothetical protein
VGKDKPRRRDRRDSALERPPRAFKPADLLDFIELPAFTRKWEQLGLDDEGDLSALQLQIMAGPKDAPVIQGTRGIRKMRFAPQRWNVGKSSAVRVLYVHFGECGIVLLCLTYSKGEADDISDGTKKQLNNLVLEIELELHRKFSGC